MIYFHRQIMDDPAYYEDASGKRYRRLVGGIGWPQAGRAAFAIVLTEDQSDPPQYIVQTSLEDHNAYNLMVACKGLELEYPVKAWHTDVSNRTMMQLLYEFNRGKEGSQRITVQGAPQSQDARNSGYYLPLVLERVKPGQKQLSVGASPGLLAELENVNTSTGPAEYFNRDIGEWPALAALCYPLAYMLTYKPVHRRSRPFEHLGNMGWQL